MSENKIHVRLNSEELFDKLLEESKKKLETVEENDTVKSGTNGNGFPDKAPTDTDLTDQKRNLDSNEEELLPFRRIGNLKEKITSTLQESTEISQEGKIDSPKEKVHNQSEEIVSFNVSQERTMTKSPLLGKDDYYKIKKNFHNDTASTEIANCLREYIFSSGVNNSEKNDNFNQDTVSLFHSYSLSDVQSLDNTVENVIVSETKQIAPCSSENISEKYFQEGSHFGLKIPASSNITKDISSNIKGMTNHPSKKRNAHSPEKVVSNILLDQKLITNKSSKKETSKEIYNHEKNLESEPAELEYAPIITNKPGPKPKSYPDIYLHKDKINILRQMSQVFNSESSHNNDILDLNNQNNAVDSKEISDKPLDQENICGNSVELDHLTKNNEIHFEQNEINSQVDIIDNQSVIGEILEDTNQEELNIPADILGETNIANPLAKKAISEEIKTEYVKSECNIVEAKCSRPVHLVSSTDVKYEKEIKVQTLIGKNGEDIDVIDGFAFVSFESAEKLLSYKNKMSTKSKIMKRKRRHRLLLKKRKLKKKSDLFVSKDQELRSINSNSLADISKEAYSNGNLNQLKETSSCEMLNKEGDSNVNDCKISAKENIPVVAEKSSCFKAPVNPGIQLKCSKLKKRIHIINKNLQCKRNEILYLYSGGELITLAGSISKISTTNTGPLRGRVVLPNDMDYMDIRKKEALQAVKPIEINEDLALFALSALQSPKHTDTLKDDETLSTNNKVIANDIFEQSVKPINDFNNDVSNLKKDVEGNNKEVSPSKVKWTQADVIKSTVGSNNEKPTTSKKNINRFPSLSREMKRLDMHFISCDNAIQEEISHISDGEETCSKEAFCNLGCICASLRCKKIASNHCGRPDCMLDCSCQIDNLGEMGINISKARSVSILKVDKEHQDGLAAEEKEFKKTIVQSGSDVFLLGERKKRDIKLPERYRDTDNYRLKISDISNLALKPTKKSIAASYVSPEDYSKYIKKFQIEMTWYKIPNTVSVWCMFHKFYDCKCLFDPKYAHKHEQDMEYLSSSSSDESSDNENNVKEMVVVDSQSKVIICQKLVKSGQGLASNKTYVFKYWIHNGEHHTARSCGYEMKNMRFEHIEKMPYHYPEPSKPLVMGMSSKISNYIPPRIRKSANLSPGKRHSLTQIKPNVLNSLSSPANGRFKDTLSTVGSPMDNMKDHTSGSSDFNNVSNNYDASRISLHWMIKEEERRGELDLDLSGNIPGRMIIVSEPRFKKLLNMCIIGIVGLSSNHRCIISTVKSTQDLVKMQKIHHLIMNNTVDVGPHMKEIFFTPSGNKCRYVMIRCDSIGRWEIFGVVQKKNENECSSKKNSPLKPSVIKLDEPNRTSQEVTGDSEVYQEPLTNSLEVSQNLVKNCLNATQDLSKTSEDRLQTEMYVNESRSKEDCLPVITAVVSAAGSSINSLSPGENESSDETDSAEEMACPQESVEKPTISPKKSNSRSFVDFNSGCKKIFLQNKGFRNAISLAAIAPHQSHLTLKPLTNDRSKLNTLTKIESNSNAKATCIVVPPGQSNDNAKTVYFRPVKKSTQYIFPKTNPATSKSIPISVASPDASLIRPHLNASFTSPIGSKKSKLFKSSILPISKRSNTPLILKKGNNSTTNLFSKGISRNENNSSSTPSLHTEEAANRSVRFDREPTNHIMVGETLSNDKVDRYKSNDIFESSSQKINTAIDCKSDTLAITKISSSDDLSLRLDTSSDTNDSNADSVIGEDSENITTTSSFSNLESGDIDSLRKTGLNKMEAICTVAGTPEAKKLAPPKNSSPELVYISSQKMEECSCIDMSINFQSVKLHWLAGTISKVVLSTILIQSEKRGVPISLVVESSGKMVKFYGQRCYVKKNHIPILLLGTDLSRVKRNTLLNYSACFKDNLVKYIVKFSKSHISTFIHDKTGLNLVRLKNFTRNKGFASVCNSKLKIPIDILRGPIKYSDYCKYHSDYAPKQVKESPTKTNRVSVSVGKTSVVPVFICKPGEKKQTAGPKVKPDKRRPVLKYSYNAQGINFLNVCPNKRKLSTSNKLEGNFKKAKFSNDVATTAHLGNTSKGTAVSLQGKYSQTITAGESAASDEIQILSTCGDEIDPNLCDINPSSLLDSSNNKAFGIACYEEKKQIIDLEDEKPAAKLKSKATKVLESGRPILKQPRKQSLKRTRECDAGSESFDDSASSSSVLDGTKSPKKKLHRRMQRVAEEHNMREKYRRNIQSVLFRYLRSLIFENGIPNDRETGTKISKGNILNDAILKIKCEEKLSSDLSKEENILRAHRQIYIEKMEKFLPALPESKRNELTQLLQGSDLNSPSAKEDVMKNFKPTKPFIVEENINVKEDGSIE